MLQKRMTVMVSIGSLKELSQCDCNVLSNGICYHSSCGAQSLWKIPLIISSNTKELPSCCNYAEDSLRMHTSPNTGEKKCRDLKAKNYLTSLKKNLEKSLIAMEVTKAGRQLNTFRTKLLFFFHYTISIICFLKSETNSAKREMWEVFEWPLPCSVPM